MIAQARSITVKTGRENAYLDAVATLYPVSDDSNDYSNRKAVYQQAMEHVFIQYPDDLEAAVFYALALISNASPKDKKFTKQKQALRILQQALNQQPEHPGIIAHYIIHSSDYPELAELGLEAARAYTKIAPAVPHALHMPSHLFIRLGQWQDAIQSNLMAYQTAQDHAQPWVSQYLESTTPLHGLYAIRLFTTGRS